MKLRVKRGAYPNLLSYSSNQYDGNPVLTLVEAKDNDIRIGLGQCVAQMFAAQIFNNPRGFEKLSIYGAVSTGTNWKFLTLENNKRQN